MQKKTALIEKLQSTLFLFIRYDPNAIKSHDRIEQIQGTAFAEIFDRFSVLCHVS